MSNLILIGMPGSGKTVVGQAIALQLARSFFDSDAILENWQDRTISQIFASDGESAFRALETEVIADLSALWDVVIATGGGVVLSPVNMGLLKANGIVVFLNRDLEQIVGTIETGHRPLLKDGKESLYALYESRIALYRQYADIEVSNNGSIAETVAEIIEKVGAELEK